MKFNVRSGKVRLSLWHCPGLGSGTFELSTASQLELIEDCSLKLPSKVSVISWSENAHTALPEMLLGGVVNVP